MVNLTANSVNRERYGRTKVTIDYGWGVMIGMGSLLSGCAGGSGPSEPTEEQTVVVYAAASLKRAFEEIIQNFEAANEGIKVTQLITDGSSTLATQIIEGAPANVFASADERNMGTVSDAGMAVSAKLFATNTLVVAAPAATTANVTTLADLANVTTVLCAPEVPCGTASVKLLEAAGVSVTPASYEQNVTAVLTKVAAGEADAGLVYATDVAGDDAVKSFVPEGATDIVNKYPITALTGAAYPAAAQRLSTMC